MTSVVLASASPARLALLRACGLDPQVVVSHVDEPAVEAAARQRDPHVSPGTLAQLLAEAKGESVASRVPARTDLVIACDSVLEIDGRVHGKPGTAEVARERWSAMRGRTGVLHTGHHVVHLPTGRSAGAPASALVHFAGASDAEIDGYVATGEPLHVAGAFTVDSLGGAFIERVEGDPSTVVGMSLSTLRHLCGDLGIRWTDLWTAPVAS